MTTREAFERGTDTFNAHDLAGFADVLADDVAFVAPGGVRGEGKAACAAFFGGWFGAFPDAHVEVHGLHVAGDDCRQIEVLLPRPFATEAVIGAAVLREVVRADALAAIP